MSVITITKENFQKEVTESKETILLDFWAAWCGPCRMLSPVVDEAAKELKNVKIGKVNVDEERALAERFGIMSIPTLIVLKDGKEVKRSLGAIPKSAVLDLVRNA